MLVEMDFLQLHLDYFPKNCGDLSEVQDEGFHQDIHILKELFQDQWGINFLADYCWWLKRDAVIAELRIKSPKRPFILE